MLFLKRYKTPELNEASNIVLAAQALVVMKQKIFHEAYKKFKAAKQVGNVTDRIQVAYDLALQEMKDAEMRSDEANAKFGAILTK